MLRSHAFLTSGSNFRSARRPLISICVAWWSLDFSCSSAQVIFPDNAFIPYRSSVESYEQPRKV